MITKPAPIPHFTLAADVALQITDLEARVPAAVNAANAIGINDDRTHELAVNARAALKAREKDAEDLRDPIVRPHNAWVKEINARFKKLTDAIAAAVVALDKRILTYRKEAQRRIDEENAKHAAEAEAARKAEEARVAAEAVKVGFSGADAKELAQLEAADAVPAPVPIPDVPKTVRTSFGATGTVKAWDFAVTDLAALAIVLPEAIEVKRGVVLDRLRAQEKAGIPEAEVGLAGIRAFKADSLRGR